MGNPRPALTRRSVLAGLARAAALGPATSLLASACAGSPSRPTRPDPASIRADVRDFGAVGNGAADDTGAFAAAIAAVASRGGVVAVPGGTYLVNPLQSIVLADHVVLSLSPDALLQAIAVAAPSSAVVLIKDLTNAGVTGGTIVGERERHLGTTGEWGMGIDIRGGSDITIRDVTIRECWGDGIYVGAGRAGEARRVTIQDCRALQNRRQGVSMTACVSSLVERCELSGTRGVTPQSGIDLEPNAPYAVRDITIRDCVVAQNAGWGIVLSGSAVTDVRVERNRCVENASFGGIGLVKAANCTVRSNTVEWNGRSGVWLEATADNVLSDNVVRHNSQQQPLRWSNVMIGAKSASNLVSGNTFVDSSADTAGGPRFDVTVAADCDANRIVGNALRPRQFDAQQLPIGGIQNESPTTFIADNT